MASATAAATTISSIRSAALIVDERAYLTQGVKFLLYKNFRAVLFSLLFFTCLWTLYSSVVFLRDTSGSYMNWK